MIMFLRRPRPSSAVVKIKMQVDDTGPEDVCNVAADAAMKEITICVCVPLFGTCACANVQTL